MLTWRYLLCLHVLEIRLWSSSFFCFRLIWVVFFVLLHVNLTLSFMSSCCWTMILILFFLLSSFFWWWLCSVWKIVLHLCGNVLHDLHSARDIQILLLVTTRGLIPSTHITSRICGNLKNSPRSVSRFGSATLSHGSTAWLILDLA